MTIDHDKMFPKRTMQIHNNLIDFEEMNIEIGFIEMAKRGN